MVGPVGVGVALWRCNGATSAGGIREGHFGLHAAAKNEEASR